MASGGPPASRARSAATGRRLPPALSPATTDGRPAPGPSGEATQASASNASSVAAGKTCSGASRYSTLTTSHPDATASARQHASQELTEPTTQPPPW